MNDGQENGEPVFFNAGRLVEAELGLRIGNYWTVRVRRGKSPCICLNLGNARGALHHLSKAMRIPPKLSEASRASLTLRREITVIMQQARA